MTTWTNMKINQMIEFSAHLIDKRMHIKISSPYGECLKSVEELKSKVADRELHPVVRRQYREMLEYWESLK